MVKAYKFIWINNSGKMQRSYFETEKIGFDWLERYGMEYEYHIETMVSQDEIEQLF